MAKYAILIYEDQARVEKLLAEHDPFAVSAPQRHVQS